MAPARWQGYYPHTTIRHYLYQRRDGYYFIFEHQPKPAIKGTEFNIYFNAKTAADDAKTAADWKAFGFRLSSKGGQSRGGSEGRNLLAIYRRSLVDGTPDFEHIAYDANSRGYYDHYQTAQKSTTA